MSSKEIAFDTWDFPEGSMLFNVTYYERPECFEVIYYDPGSKRLEVSYRRPIIDIWFTKNEFRSEFEDQVSQLEIVKCYCVHCKPSQIPKVIAENCGNVIDKKTLRTYGEYYERYHKEMSSFDLKAHMCECPYVFKGDFLPDVYFRLQWMKKYGIEGDVSNVTSCLLDIETDVLDRPINMKNIHEAPQPINAITLILPEQKICAVMALGSRSESQIHVKFHGFLEKQTREWEWLKTHQEEFKREIIESDEDNKRLLEGYDIRLHLFEFNDEINMIKTVFDYINKYRPWFCQSWNAKFDHNYLFERIKYLGYDPYSIIIPPEIKTSRLYYSEDKSKKLVIKKATDWWFTSTFTVYLCQMRLFAQTRKNQKEQPSYSLNYIGKEFAGIEKLEDAKAGKFREFAYVNFIKFLLYNVRDVVVQLGVLLATRDDQSLVSNSYMFGTQHSKCFKETHIVRNMREYFFESDGYVQSCKLLLDPNIDTAFPGAYVAPPEKNAPTGYRLNGKIINNVIYGALDADAKSYYPSTKMGCNLDPMALIFKCVIDNGVFTSGKCLNKSLNQEYIWYDHKSPPQPHSTDMSGPIMNAYKNKNRCSLLSNWHNVPTVTEYMQYLDANLGGINIEQTA